MDLQTMIILLCLVNMMIKINRNYFHESKEVFPMKQI